MLLKSLLIITILFISEVVMAETLVKVYELTQDEQSKIAQANEEINKARKRYNKLIDDIAHSHGASKEDWMEWRSWYVVSGKYILQYHQDHMTIME